MVQESVVLDQTDHFLHVCTNFVRHACCHSSVGHRYAVDHPKGLRPILQKHCKICRRRLALVGGGGSGGDAAINAVDAHCVHCVVNVWVRSVHVVPWRGKMDFFHDCKNHAQLD